MSTRSARSLWLKLECARTLLAVYDIRVPRVCRSVGGTRPPWRGPRPDRSSNRAARGRTATSSFPSCGMNCWTARSGLSRRSSGGAGSRGTWCGEPSEEPSRYSVAHRRRPPRVWVWPKRKPRCSTRTTSSPFVNLCSRRRYLVGHSARRARRTIHEPVARTGRCRPADTSAWRTRRVDEFTAVTRSMWTARSARGGVSRLRPARSMRGHGDRWRSIVRSAIRRCPGSTSNRSGCRGLALAKPPGEPESSKVTKMKAPPNSRWTCDTGASPSRPTREGRRHPTRHPGTRSPRGPPSWYLRYPHSTACIGSGTVEARSSAQGIRRTASSSASRTSQGPRIAPHSCR